MKASAWRCITTLLFQSAAFLLIIMEHPFLGASPDGLVNCSCCSDGLCELSEGV